MYHKCKENQKIRYAGDIVLLAETEKELQNFVDKIICAGENYGMLLKIKKTKVMVVTTKVTEVINVVVKGLKLEQVEEYKYLGSWITSDNDNKKEIKTRIGMAKGAFWKQKELMRGNWNIKLKERLLNLYIFYMLSYRCES